MINDTFQNDTAPLSDAELDALETYGREIAPASLMPYQVPILTIGDLIVRAAQLLRSRER
jgi:hypothetical protein